MFSCVRVKAGAEEVPAMALYRAALVTGVVCEGIRVSLTSGCFRIYLEEERLNFAADSLW